MTARPPKVRRPDPVPRVRSAVIARLPADGVGDFWERVGGLPLVEESDVPGHSVVTFCRRDAHAEQVLLFVNRLTDETDLAATMLERHGTTDLWHASFRMRSDWRASYSFLARRPGEPAPWESDGHVALRAALDRGSPDQRNPDACRNRAGTVQSVVSLPQAPAQPWLAERRGVARGSIREREGPGGRAVRLYDPAGAGPRDALPLLVMLDGEVWTTHQSLPTTLDNLIADGRIPPVRAVFPSSGSRDERWAELGGPDGSAYIVDRLVPWVRSRRGVSGQVVVAGQSLGGLTALRAGLTRPDVVTGVASQSASLWLDDLREVITPGARTRIHLSWGIQEWVLDGPHRDLAKRLRNAGIPLRALEINGGHDYAWWRGTIADALIDLLG